MSEPATPPSDSPKGATRFLAITGAASLLTIVGTIIRSKATAYFVGPAGLGLYAETLQWLTLACAPATLAAGPALIAAVSRAKTDDPGAVSSFMSTSILAGGAMAAIGVAAVSLLRDHLIHASDEPIALYFLLLGVGSILLNVTQAVSATLTGMAALRWMTWTTLASAAVATVTHVAALAALGNQGQFIAMPVSAAASALLALYFARRLDVRLTLVWRSDFVRSAVRLGATTLVAAVYTQLVYSSARIALDRAGGAELGTTYNGQYQAALAIGQQYFGVVLGALGAYFFPRYAAARTPEALTAEVHDAVTFIFRFGVPIVLAMLALRGVLIPLLYSDRFEGAVGILGFQLAADVAKAVSWAYAGPLLYRGDIRAFLLTETLGAAIAITSNLACVELWGLEGIGIASAITYAIYLVLVVVVVRKAQGIRTARAHVALGLVLTVAMVAFELASRRWWWLNGALFALAAVWLGRTGAFGYLAQRLRARLP